MTGLEPATSGVTGRHSNQLSYTRFAKRRRRFEVALMYGGREWKSSAVSALICRFYKTGRNRPQTPDHRQVSLVDKMEPLQALDLSIRTNSVP